MEMLKPLLPADFVQAPQHDPALDAWTARRSCADCAGLVLAASSPLMPASLEPVVYPLDDALIQGPYRNVQLFACTGCGRRWCFTAEHSHWAQQL